MTEKSAKSHRVRFRLFAIGRSVGRLLPIVLALAVLFGPVRAFQRVGPPEPEPREQARKLREPIVISQPNSVYRVTQPLEFPGTAFIVAAEDVTLDLGGHTVYFAAENAAPAVRLYLDWADGRVYPLLVSSPAEPRGFRATNGCLILAGSAGGQGVSGYRGYEAQLEKLRIEVNGADAAGVAFDNGGCTLSQCVLVGRDVRPGDRHAGPALVRVPEGAVVAEQNVLLGGNSGFNVGSGSRLRGNLIVPEATVTNGYGIWLYRREDVQCLDNLILPRNGRGALLNAGERCLIRDNVILAWERPNEEYGPRLNAGALRLRYEAANHRVERNTLLAVGGSPWTGATALYLSNTGIGVNRLLDNDCTAILVGDPQHADHYAKALSFEVPEPKQPTRDEIRGNVFRSNHWLLATSGPDGGSRQGPIIDNSFEWTDGAQTYARFAEAVARKQAALPIAAHPVAESAVREVLDALKSALHATPLREDRRTIFARCYDVPESITILNSTGDARWTLEDLHAFSRWNSTASIRVGHTKRIRCQDAAGRPLAQQPLSVTVAADTIEYAATDAEGWADLPVIERLLEKLAGLEIAWRESKPATIRIEIPKHDAVEVAPEAMGEVITFRAGGG